MRAASREVVGCVVQEPDGQGQLVQGAGCGSARPQHLHGAQEQQHTTHNTGDAHLATFLTSGRSRPGARVVAVVGGTGRCKPLPPHPLARARRRPTEPAATRARVAVACSFELCFARASRGTDRCTAAVAVGLAVSTPRGAGAYSPALRPRSVPARLRFIRADPLGLELELELGLVLVLARTTQHSGTPRQTRETVTTVWHHGGRA